ncbi:MFS transporter [Streptomyces sp. NPDC001279]|uniref:MFS transporter n=1 Tax=Streptomyces sp. NPDC001279 TaxID=3364556 RepID=UPI00368ABF55
MTATAQPLASAVGSGPAGQCPALKERLGYFAGNFGNILLSTTISSFLLLYLTDVLGLAAAAVVVAVLGNGALLFVPYDTVPAILVCLAVAGLGMGTATTLNYTLLAELTDYVEWHHGHRTEGALASLASFAAKAGGGLGGAATAYCLGLFGYVAHADQSERALDGIRYAQGGIPMTLILLGGLVFLAYPINRHVSARIANELAERRAAVPAGGASGTEDADGSRDAGGSGSTSGYGGNDARGSGGK